MDELIRQLGLDPTTIDARVLREIGRKYYARSVVGQKVSLASPSKVAQHCRATLEHEPQEHFMVIAVDARMRVVSEHVVCKGGLSAVPVHPRDVFRRAVTDAAHAIILVHNHPSGDPEPSSDDMTLTQRMKAAGDILGIPVLDHLVVARGGYVSLRERHATMF